MPHRKPVEVIYKPMGWGRSRESVGDRWILWRQDNVASPDLCPVGLSDPLFRSQARAAI